MVYFWGCMESDSVMQVTLAASAQVLNSSKNIKSRQVDKVTELCFL